LVERAAKDLSPPSQQYAAAPKFKSSSPRVLQISFNFGQSVSKVGQGIKRLGNPLDLGLNKAGLPTFEARLRNVL
jgi:hypothetical protein